MILQANNNRFLNPIWSTGGIVLLYVLVNLSYFTVLSVRSSFYSVFIFEIFVQIIFSNQRVQAAEVATAQVFCDNIFPQLSFLIPIFVALSCFGGINGSLFASGRIFYVAGKKGHLPPFLSMVSIGANTPAPAGLRL